MAEQRAPSGPGTAGPEEVRTGTRFGLADDQHEIGEELGSGAAARVFSCKRLRTGEQLAVKVINLQRLKLLGDLDSHIDKLDREVRILSDLRHMRIVTLHQVHRTENWYFVVMERIRGGELFNQIVQHKTLSEVESRYIFRQLLEGIGYMHAKRIIHRDLKPENILIVASTPAPPPAGGILHDVKIADFGLAKILSEGMSVANTFVGTPQYYAPEVIRVRSHGGSYNQAADYWGLGVVLFVMLCGRYPFDGKKKPIEQQIQSASYRMDTARWKGISEDAKDLIRGLLRVDPNERLRLEECAHHPWVAGSAGCTPLVLPLTPLKVTSPIHRPRFPGYPQEIEHLSQLPEAEVSQVHSRAEDANLVDDEDAPDTSPPIDDADPAIEHQQEECESHALCVHATLERKSRSSSEQSCTEVAAVVDREELPNEISVAARRVGERWWAYAKARVPKHYRRLIRRTAFGLAFTLYLMIVQRMTMNWMDLQEPDPTLNAAPPAELQKEARGYRGIGSVPGLAWPEPKRSTAVGYSAASNARHEAAAREPPLVDQCRAPPKERRSDYPPGLAQTIAQNIAQSMAQYTRGPFPSLPQLGHDINDMFNNSTEAPVNQTIFRLSELLKLQVSIAGSLEMACLAIRHADTELAEATRQTSRQAREVFQLAADVVAKYANVAQQVSHFVLPDLQLAVQEGEPSLAASLLDMVKSWVAAMKTDGEEVRHRYSQLQAAVLSLARRAQDTKSGADRRLAVAVRVVETEISSAESPSPPPQSGFTLDLDQSLAQSTVSLNSWTRQLFEQLTELTALSGQGGQGEAGSVQEAGQYGNFDIDDIDLAWKRELVDLLFLAPGVAPDSLPKIEPLHFNAQGKDSEVPSYREDDMIVEDDSESSPGANSGTSQRGQTEQPANAVVTYVRTEGIKSEAEFATHSSAALLRALRELKRVDGILQGCSAFWANMDGTVQTLSQMKDHTESLVKFAARNPRLRERFDQRLAEYINFWTSLERLCRQYCADHQAASAKMQEFIREMTDAADIIDTAESAKAGIMAGRQDRLQINQTLAAQTLAMGEFNQ